MAMAGLSTFFSFLRAITNVRALMATGQAGDGREKALLDHVLQTAERGNPKSVMEAIDSYGRRTSWLMNIGDDKGFFLDAALAKYNPRVALEIGTYCGYSAVRIASQLQRPGSMLLAVEMSPLNSQIATQIVDHAGLSSKVRVVEGKFDERLDAVKQFLEERDAPFFDFVLLDHWKNRYMPDYLVLKEKGMIRKGSGIFADNMGPVIGPADFKKYVKTHPEELETEEFKSNTEYIRWMPDSVTVSTYKLD